MKRIVQRLVLAVGALSLVLPGAGLQTPAPLASLAKISVLPSRVEVRIVLEPSSAVPNLTAAYDRDFPSRLVLDLGRIQPPALPSVPADEPALVKGLKFLPGAESRTALLVDLSGPVPYRVSTEGGKTIVELTKILAPNKYMVSAETQAALDKSKDPDVTLSGVEIADKSDRTDVTARLGRKAVANIFALDNPLRLVVDIYGAVLTAPTTTKQIGTSGLEQIKIGQFREAPPHSVARLVFELAGAHTYGVMNEASGLTISFPKSPAPAAARAVPAVAVSTSGPATPAPRKEPPAKDKEIAAKPAEAPAAKPVPSSGEAVSQTIVPKDPPAVPVPKNETSSLDKTPPLANPPQVPAKIEKKADDPGKNRTVHDPQEKYTGEPISPRFKDAELVAVVQWLAEFAGLNVVFDPQTRGTVTISVDSIPWDQFLDLILMINNQGKILEGNVLRIAPISKLAEEEKSQQSLRDAKEQSGPMQTKIYTLSYAKSKDVVELLKGKKSGRGEIVTDDRTNTVIVTDVKEKIDLFDTLVATLDTATPQVQIEARIVEATSSFIQNLGIQWGAKGIADPFYGNQTSLQFPNKVLVDGAMIPQGIVTKGIGGPLGGYAVNLPAASFNSAVGLSFANILDTFRLDVALSALETSGDGKIQSTERITTQNNKEGYVNQGRQIPVQTSANFTVTTQYVNAGLELRVTPQITAEGTIIMTIEIKNDAADFANLVNGIPPITTQSAKTTVTVADGGTTVIGGVYRIEDSITRERVPFLYQIPILGNLFKSFSKTKSNRELLIFITPRIQK
jgi:type IV pilus secretin PilQ/predicted competence protein